MLENMQRLNRPKPDIRVWRSGRIDILTKAARRMGLSKESYLSFLLDEEGNLYLRRDPAEGLRPTSVHGNSYLRFWSAATTRRILLLPDVPQDAQSAAFRIGEPEDGQTFPVITRRLL